MLFIVSAACLLLIVLAILVRPLWKDRVGQNIAGQERRQANLAVLRGQMLELEVERDEGSLSAADFEQAKNELQRRLLEEVGGDEKVTASSQPSARRLAVALMLVLPLLAAGGYYLLGNPKALDPLAHSAQVTPDQIEQMVAKLAERMQANPEDSAGWAMLAKSYKALGKVDLAVSAYEKIEAMVFTDPDLLADYADLRAQQAGGRLDGKPLEYVMRALQLDPNHVLALWLAGTAKFASADYAAAVDFWQRAISVLPVDSEDARMLAEGVAEAKKRLGLKGSRKKSVAGKVSLAPALQSSVSPDDTVFIFARLPDGGRMPVAVVKTRVADLPYEFVLDDSSAMLAEQTISQQKSVVVLARVSKTGNVMLKPGDLESQPQTAKPGVANLRLVIDQQR